MKLSDITPNNYSHNHKKWNLPPFPLPSSPTDSGSSLPDGITWLYPYENALEEFLSSDRDLVDVLFETNFTPTNVGSSVSTLEVEAWDDVLVLQLEDEGLRAINEEDYKGGIGPFKINERYPGDFEGAFHSGIYFELASEENNPDDFVVAYEFSQIFTIKKIECSARTFTDSEFALELVGNGPSINYSSGDNEIYYTVEGSEGNPIQNDYLYLLFSFLPLKNSTSPGRIFDPTAVITKLGTGIEFEGHSNLDIFKSYWNAFPGDYKLSFSVVSYDNTTFDVIIKFFKFNDDLGGEILVENCTVASPVSDTEPLGEWGYFSTTYSIPSGMKGTEISFRLKNNDPSVKPKILISAGILQRL